MNFVNGRFKIFGGKKNKNLCLYWIYIDNFINIFNYWGLINII